MVKNVDQRLEKKILELTDYFIEVVISVDASQGEQKERNFQRGVQIAAELGQLLLYILEGKREHLEVLFLQLVNQKIPDDNILSSFGNFTEDLKKIIEEGIYLCLQKDASLDQTPNIEEIVNDPVEEEPVIKELNTVPRQKNTSIMEHELVDCFDKPKRPELEAALKVAFPDAEIYKQFSLRGMRIEYYLPAYKVAVEKESNAVNCFSRKRYFCQKYGIMLITISQTELQNIRRAARIIRRKAQKSIS